MKKKILITLAFCSLIVTSKVQAQPVNAAFEDDNFYKCVIENYNIENNTTKTVNDSLTDQELSSIKKLDCANKSITITTGLEKLTGLLKLDLENNNIKQINIENNTLLRYINIWGNPSDLALNISNNSNLKIILGKVDGTVDDSIINNFITPTISTINTQLIVGETLDYSEYMSDDENITYKVLDPSIVSFNANNIVAIKAGKTIIEKIQIFENFYPEFTGDDANEYLILEDKEVIVKETSQNETVENSKTTSNTTDNPKTGVTSYGTAGLLSLITIGGIYILYKNKMSNI